MNVLKLSLKYQLRATPRAQASGVAIVVAGADSVAVVTEKARLARVRSSADETSEEQVLGRVKPYRPSGLRFLDILTSIKDADSRSVVGIMSRVLQHVP